MPNPLAATFGRQLKAARQARGLTQAELAEQVGLAVEVCGRLERGRVLPRADTLVRLAAALRVSTDALLGLGADEQRRLPADTAEPEATYPEPPEMRRLVRKLRGQSRRTIKLIDALVSGMKSEPRRGR